jgi:hypothetical protein
MILPGGTAKIPGLAISRINSMSCLEGDNTVPAALTGASTLDAQTRLELEAAAFRGLVAHLQRRTDVQNIDLMNLAGFCRNCLSKWYLAAAQERGLALDYDDARKVVYGMPFEEWKTEYQRKATPEQLQTFEATTPLHAFVSGHSTKT